MNSNVLLPFFGDVPLPHPWLSIRGNIPNVNKTLNKILQNSCSEKCQQNHVCGEVKVIQFYTKSVNWSFRPTKIVLAHNIGHVSDKSLHVYHFDRHEVLFQN